MYPTDPEHLQVENKGFSRVALVSQQNLHLGTSSLEVSSMFEDSRTLSTSSYSSRSSADSSSI
jgi:hypothetical protein